MLDADQFFSLRNRSRRVVPMPAEVDSDRAADHQLHEVRLAQLRRGLRRDVSAVAQHRDRVAEAIHLRHAMRHVDARHVARFQIVDQRVETLGLHLAQAARRLVEDDDARSAADGNGDLHHLLLRDRQLAESSRHVEVGADRCQHLARTTHDGAPVDEAA